MVKIINYQENMREDGTSFFSLKLQGGIQMIRSADTGKYYATLKTVLITSTFDEQTCKSLIGTDLEGYIVKQDCEPYQYVIKQTGEVITLSHRWVYVPENEEQSFTNKLENTFTEKFTPNVEEFSQNGELQTI